MSYVSDLILRELVYPPLVTKGAVLDNADFDNNMIKIYNEFFLMNNALRVLPYSADYKFMQGDYSLYGSKVWRSATGSIEIPNQGNTPEEGIIWGEVSIGNLIGVIDSNTIGITANPGGGITNATLLPFKFNRVDNCASDLDSVKTLPSNRGDRLFLFNNTSHPINFYPSDGESFVITQASNSPLLVIPGQIVQVFCFQQFFWTIISQTSASITNELNGSDENIITSAIGTPTKISKKSNVVTGVDGGTYMQCGFNALPGRSFQVEISIGESPEEALNLLPKSGDFFEKQAVDTPFVFGEREFYIFYCARTGYWRVK